MANPAMVVKVLANLEDLKAQLKTGQFAIEQTTSKMVAFGNSFSGARTVQNAHDVQKAIELIGGATNLTAKEQAQANRILEEALDKYRALGREAPPGMAKLAAETKQVEQHSSLLGGTMGRLTAAFTAASLIDRGVSSLMAFGAEAMSAASATVNLADQTGLSTTTIQQMRHVADQTGTSLETFTKAALKLSVNLAGGQGSVREAVADLGLEFNELRSMNPEQQFNAITTALGDMENPQERNRLALELFGKAGADILPAIAQGYQRIAADARISGEDQVRAVDAAGNAWAKFKTDSVSAITSTIGNLVLLSQSLGTVGSRLLGINVDALIAADSFKNTGNAAGVVAEVFIDFSERARQAAEDVSALSEAKREQVEDAKRLGATVEEITDQFGLSADAQKILTEEITAGAKAHSSAESAAKKHQDALDELKFAGDGWRTTLEQINPVTLEAVEGYLKAGVSQGALAEAFSLTAQQVKAVTLAIEEETKADKHAESALAQVAKLRAENTALEISMSSTTKAARIADIEAEFQAAKAMLVRKKEMTAEADAELTRQRDLKVQKESASYDFLAQHSRQALVDQYETARTTYEEMANRSGEFSAFEIQAARDRMFQRREEMMDWQGGFTDAADKVQEKAKETIKVLRQMTVSSDIQPLTLTELSRLRGDVSVDQVGSGDSKIWKKLSELEKLEGTYAPKSADQYTEMIRAQILLAQLRMWAQGKERPQGLWTGTDNWRGGPAMVGERGPEIVDLPRGARVTPNHQLGGVNLTVNLTVKGSVIGTDRDFQQGVSDALLSVFRSNGLSLPAVN